jgi:hypothetical protein
MLKYKQTHLQCIEIPCVGSSFVNRARVSYALADNELKYPLVLFCAVSGGSDAAHGSPVGSRRYLRLDLWSVDRAELTGMRPGSSQVAMGGDVAAG